MDGRIVDRRVAKTKGIAIPRALQIVQQKILDRNGHVEVSLIIKKLVGIQQSVTDESRINNRWRVLGHIESPRLPVEVVAPAVSGKHFPKSRGATHENESYSVVISRRS